MNNQDLTASLQQRVTAKAGMSFESQMCITQPPGIPVIRCFCKVTLAIRGLQYISVKPARVYIHAYRYAR